MKLLLALLAFVSSGLASPPSAAIPAGPLAISPASKDLIVEFETGGKSYYQSKLQRPTYPGGASGTTVGIGYDCGYNTRAQILADWSALPVAARNALAATAGIRGIRAKTSASAIRWVIVPWDNAESVFVANSMPRFAKLTAAAFPGVTATHGHVQGVLLSLSFNRGTSMSGSSRAEMRAVRDHVTTARIPLVPADIRQMKRLWIGKGLDGLLRRREAEARLIESAL